MQAQPRAEMPQGRMPARDGMIVRFVRPSGTFLAHFGEMCVTMCVGTAVLSLLFFGGAALLGYTNLLQRFPELSTAVLAINMSLPMVAWMRIRGHEWRPTLEMAGAAIAVGILLIAALSVGLVPTSGDLVLRQCGLSCLAMLAVMLFRLDLYTRHAGHVSHGHAA